MTVQYGSFLRRTCGPVAVSFLQLPQPLRIADLDPAVLRLPTIEHLLIHPMLAAQLRRVESRFGLLQSTYSLLLCVTALLQALIVSIRRCRSLPAAPNAMDSNTIGTERSPFMLRWAQLPAASMARPPLGPPQSNP